MIGVLLLDALVLGADRVRVRAGPGRGALDPCVPFRPRRFCRSAFAIGSQRVVSVQSVAIAIGGGMLAAIVAVLSPLRDILSRDPLAAITRTKDARAAPGGTLAGARGLVCLAAATVILLAAPEQAIPGMVLLVGALLLVLPLRAERDARARQAVARADHERGPARRGDGAAAPRRHGLSRSRRPERSRCSAASRSRARMATCCTGLENAAHDMNASTDRVGRRPPATTTCSTTPVPSREQATARTPLRVCGRSALYRGGLLD